MFQPFDNASQFYPGLIVWCDPNCYEMDISTLAPEEPYDRKKARELRPCLVVAVDYPSQCFQVARLCATKPTDARRWVRIDSPPPIRWRLSDAWIWVGTPPTVAMVFNNPKVMHPHKDTNYTENPVASTNLQNYWIHRQNYITRRQMGGSATTQGRTSLSSMASHSNPRYAMNPNPVYHTPQAASGQYNNFNQLPSPSVAGNTIYSSASGNIAMNTPSFSTLSAQPVVVPAGFSETNPNSPGWWRNPETGWFWHASRGLLPPDSRR
ncbi:hypothetical protein B0H11DRAFT_1900009 [Mycena galericulata]|nr:hypothetical protein B0H11DRAFT_2255544 [Mycena galericulata]KAJ7510632.1 hypothetical protein B0H11DRAFT_1900009 [Mycena galericulata]